MATLKAAAEKRACEIIEEGFAGGLASPVIANRILREMAESLGTNDPYADFKMSEMETARKVHTSIASLAHCGFRSAVELAALGNTLDFFCDTESVLNEIPVLLSEGMSFDRDDVDRLEIFLETKPASILYLTDNTGEVFFDLLLYEALSKRSECCTLVVKGGPAANDLTRKELRLSGLVEHFSDIIDTGTDGAGVDWDRVSPEFMSRVTGADLIVSKGMANFETIFPKPLPVPSFYLFRVKCEPIQDMTGIDVGGFAAVWKEGFSVHS